jgi:hypothetical protein
MRGVQRGHLRQRLGHPEDVEGPRAQLQASEAQGDDGDLASRFARHERRCQPGDPRADDDRAVHRDASFPEADGVAEEACGAAA